MAPMCMQHCPQPQGSPDRRPVVSPSAVAAIADFHWGLHGMEKLIRDTQDGDIQQLYIGKAGTNLRREMVAKRHSHLFWREWVPKEGTTYTVLCRPAAVLLPCFDGERSLAELELAFLRKAAPLFGTVFANQKMQSSLNWRREGGGAIYLMVRRATPAGAQNRKTHSKKQETSSE